MAKVIKKGQGFFAVHQITEKPLIDQPRIGFETRAKAQVRANEAICDTFGKKDKRCKI